MSNDLYGHNAAWPFAHSPLPDLPADEFAPWHQLQQLAERAGVSLEHLCQSAEYTADFALESKAEPPLYNPDLEEVIRILADDDLDFDFETKATIERHEWREANHHRDENGRFSNGSVGAASQERGHSSFPHFPTPAERKQTAMELGNVHALVERLYPNQKSRWKGITEVTPLIFLKAAGVKKWSCEIGIAYELLQSPAAKLCTMIHESLHALSPTTKEQYEKATGWEEGTIEGATRFHRDHILKQLGWSVSADFSPHKFVIRDRNHGYTPLVDALEEMRKALKISTPQSFYDHLIQTPATEIESEILNMASKLNPRLKKKFDEVFDSHAEVIKKFQSRPDMSKQPDEFKGQTQFMKREDVISAMFNARTTEEIIEARRIRDEWLEVHPNDSGIYDVSESLEMKAEAKGLRNLALEEYTKQYNAMYPPETFSTDNESKN